MARTSDSHQTGAVGTSEIQGKFERIGWAPVRNADHDLGTDFLVAARDIRKFERGLVGVQAKGGSTWFGDQARDDSGELLGWWFREDDVEHFEDWVRHPLPHLVVIHNLDTDLSYWVHVTPEVTKRTGTGCKVLVPIDQTVDHDHLDALLDVAASMGPSWTLEHTAFAAAAANVPPGSRLRYAMLAPRLVAPHRNVGYDRAIEPEEAVALIARGRLLDLERFAELHASVPDPRGDGELRDWRWRFVRAFWAWVTSDDLTLLVDRIGDAPDARASAAARVLLVTALRRTERFGEALRVVDDVIETDDLPPTDHAWVLVHRGRLRLDLGDAGGATADALAAIADLRGEHDDPTASQLGATSAWLLYRTAGLDPDKFEHMMTASDTAVAWWRSELVASALNEATIRQFRTWARDRMTRWAAEDFVRINLFASELNADLAADHAGWRGQCALRSRTQLLNAEDMDDVAEAVDGLRRCGDHDSLKLAARHLRSVGPVKVLGDAVARLTEQSWTRTTFKANLTLLTAAGDLLPPEAATAAANDCISLAANERRDFIAAMQPTFMVELDALDALAVLLPVSDRPSHDRAVRLVMSGLDHDEVLRGPLVRVVRAVDLDNVSDELRGELREFACQHDNQVTAFVLGAFAAAGDGAASDELRRRARSGDIWALTAHGDVRVLSQDDARLQVERAVTGVHQIMKLAGISAYPIGADPLRELVLFNVWFPEVADWPTLLTAFEDANVGTKHKREAAELLVRLADELTDDLRSRILRVTGALRINAPKDPTGASLGGLPATLAAAVGADDDATRLRLLIPLLMGSAAERRDLAIFFGSHPTHRMFAVLAALANDGDHDVRVPAAYAIGRLATLEPADPLVVAVAEELAGNEGEQIPLALLNGLRDGNGSPGDARLERLYSVLRRHPMATVARRAFPNSEPSDSDS